MLQWNKWVCQAFRGLLKGLREEDPVGTASFNTFAFLMLAFPYEETDSASMGGGAVNFGSHQILCVPCWVTVTSVPGSFLSTVNLELQCVQVLDLLIVVNLLAVQVNILIMAFPETKCFWKATQRICCSSIGLCHFVCSCLERGRLGIFFLLYLYRWSAL